MTAPHADPFGILSRHQDRLALTAEHGANLSRETDLFPGVYP